ncbi:MAG: transposase family protein [Deltaproteobacteria bacterium]|nr:transposase family protein [Deltaproteobacteria bacterium]
MAERLTISIIEHFGDMPDPRQQAKVLYPLSEIILLTLCAIICGADSYVEIEEFGNAKIDFLKRFLPFEHGIPSHDTIGIVFSNIDSKIFSG